ncbi:MAG: hypothetical protein DYG89_03270 [Caldilinea sp. CFX5]|nr:hypothetical protein [Caldilinea sp. CFX5]
MLALGKDVGLPSGYLLTRAKGERVYEQVKTNLLSLPEGESLYLDFAEVYAMDVSFVDEAIIRLAKEIVDDHYGQRRLVLNQLSQDATDNLNAAIALQNLTLALFSIQSDGGWQLVGHLEKSLQQVLTMIMVSREITAPRLAAELELALNAANNRLKRLYDQRLIQRRYEVTDKGLLYTYYVWPWEE